MKALYKKSFRFQIFHNIFLTRLSSNKYIMLKIVIYNHTSGFSRVLPFDKRYFRFLKFQNMFFITRMFKNTLLSAQNRDFYWSFRFEKNTSGFKYFKIIFQLCNCLKMLVIVWFFPKFAPKSIEIL